MISESEIVSRLDAVQRGQLDVFDFADWLDSSEGLNLHKQNQKAFRLASAVHRVFSEYDHHHNESALKRDLVSLISDKHIEVFVRIADHAVRSEPVNWYGSVNSDVLAGDPLSA